MARRKWFKLLLDKTVSVQRSTPTKDANGGDVPSWANISGAVNVPCSIQGFKKKNETGTEFARPDGHAEYDVFFASDLGLRDGDRIVHGSTYYHIQGNPDDASNEGLAAGPYQVKAMRRVT